MKRDWSRNQHSTVVKKDQHRQSRIRSRLPTHLLPLQDQGLEGGEALGEDGQERGRLGEVEAVAAQREVLQAAAARLGQALMLLVFRLFRWSESGVDQGEWGEQGG
jgi:hypothetical protein